MTSLLLALAWPLAQPVKPTIAAIALFKNGYAFVAREIPVTGREVRVADLPGASLGTLWFIGQDGLRVEEVVYEVAETTSQQPANSLDEILQANLGKVVALQLADKQTVGGKLIGAAGSVVIVEGEGGTMAVAKTQIVSVAGAPGFVARVERKQSDRVLRLKTDRPGKIVSLSLERGATWAPSYAVDVDDPKRLRFVAKATILNDLDDFAGIEARLVTGFPNVPFAGIRDPLVSGQSVDQFLQAIGGGFPGQTGNMMQNQAFAPREMADRWSEAIAPPDIETLQAEDLFMVRQPNVRLKKGERGYYVLFAAESDYENVYTWDIPDGMEGGGYRGLPEGPGDVWNTLVFKNTGPIPLTTGPATTFKAGNLIGQDLIKYTSVGAEANLRITKALEIRAESEEEEVTRELRDSTKPLGGWIVTMRGTLEVTNRKGEAVKMRITKHLTGEIVSTEGSPEIAKPVRGLRDANPRATLTWTLPVPAGGSRKLSYTFKVIVG